MTLLIISEIANYDIFLNISYFDDDYVNINFNGDTGFSILILNPKSNYCVGYNYVLMNIFLKYNQGFVIQSILFNELDIIHNSSYSEIFHSFKFIE
jgi:hypothetical protein